MASIMVVDDEEEMREMLKQLLTGKGHKVEVAASTKEAQTLLRIKPTNILISDIRMAPQTGFDLLKWVQENDLYIPVIFITGVRTIDYTAEVLHLGAFEYLTKPIDNSDLLAVVDRALKYAHFLKEKSSVHGKIKNQGIPM